MDPFPAPVVVAAANTVGVRAVVGAVAEVVADQTGVVGTVVESAAAAAERTVAVPDPRHDRAAKGAESEVVAKG